jgi:hypothetical protein
MNICQSQLENREGRLEIPDVPSPSTSGVDALNLQGGTFVRAGQEEVHGAIPRTDRLHAHNTLLLGPRSAQRAGARLDVMWRGQLTYMVANAHNTIGDFRLAEIESQRTDRLAPLRVQMRLWHLTFGVVYVSARNSRRMRTLR